MACYHPSRVAISRKSFSWTGSRVRDTVRVPCGHCLGCRSDQARGWAVRLVHEGVVSFPAWFATLTYDENSLPERGSLNPRHPTLFAKRLRRHFEGERFSYYLCGEYGEKNSRPHYHAVLYGPRFLDRVFYTSRNGAPVFRSETLERLWSHGLCELTGLNYAAARYVASYVRKKVRQRDSPDHYTRVDPRTGELMEIEREYGRMSRNPAIGRRWIERFWKDVYPRDFVVMDGVELKPPRYYDKWMDINHPGIMMAVREKRYEEMEDLVPERLIAMEKIHEAKVSLFQGRGDV